MTNYTIDDIERLFPTKDVAAQSTSEQDVVINTTNYLVNEANRTVCDTMFSAERASQQQFHVCWLALKGLIRHIITNCPPGLETNLAVNAVRQARGTLALARSQSNIDVVQHHAGLAMDDITRAALWANGAVLFSVPVDDGSVPGAPFDEALPPVVGADNG